MVQQPAQPVESESPAEIANEIEQNLSRMMNLDIADDPTPPQPAKSPRADSSTIKFTNLQFGRNYDPTSGT